MGHTPIQRYRFFSICWNIIYIFYAVIHIPILALLLHFAPTVQLNTAALLSHPIIIAFPLVNFFVILCLCGLAITGLLLSTQLGCCLCRLASMLILGLQTSLSLLVILTRGAIVAFCVRSIYELSTKVPPPTSTPIMTTAADPIDSNTGLPFEELYHLTFIWVIIALFLMILSAITELIQAIFSSLVLHQVLLESKKSKETGRCGIYMKAKCGDYMKMDPKAEVI